MEDEEEDDEQWTLESLKPGGHDTGTCPNAVTTRRLTREYHQRWIRAGVGPRKEPLATNNLARWLRERFNVEPLDMDWDRFWLVVHEQHVMMSNLRMFLSKHDLYFGNTEEKIWLLESARLVYNVQDLYVQMSRLLQNSDPQKDGQNMLPPHLRAANAFEEDTANVLDNDDSNNTTFQNAFIHLTHILQGMQYRRANGKFFKRIMTSSGFHTNAFEEAIDIEAFVTRHSAHSVNFKMWKWMTRPVTNFEQIVKYMKERVLSEAPDLIEDTHLRSYEGDSVGRGAGIYDCAADMFFPYVLRDEWKELADLACRVRQRTRRDYKCEAPTETVVCVIHMKCVFPYDLWGELCRLADDVVGSSWRNADKYECGTRPVLLKDGEELGDLLAERLPPPHTDAERVPERIGRSWQLVQDGVSFPPPDEPGWVELAPCRVHDVLKHHLGQAIIVLPSEMEAMEEECLQAVTMTTFARCAIGGDEYVYVPLKHPAARARAKLTAEEMEHFAVSSQTLTEQVCVTSSRGERFFRLDTGRTWLECEAKEIDCIYQCQRFTVFDRFMIYACKGRLFFEVGEFDTYEGTLFFEGVGGCGKTTIMKAEQAFWPPHLRGILSPNMQPQFGMSSVCKSKVVFCNEVSADLNIVQEEWQTACSGEWGSYAVKFDDPIVMKWIAHMFWIGNGFPTKFKNLQGQVSRRLMGVLMAHPVNPRDGGIFRKISSNLGALQRKQVLAYFEFVRINGTTDPMSQPDTLLPPAFAEYYRKSRRATDPIEDFLSEGKYVTLDPTKKMLLSEFKELYAKYRMDYDLGRALRWSEAVYRTPFNDRGLFVRREELAVIDGMEHRNVDFVIGLCACEEM